MNTFLEQAYLKTTYEVYHEAGTYALRIQQDNNYFRSFCEEKKITEWAIITAYNPYSEACSKEENENNNQYLKSVLLDHNCTVLEANGIPENTDWESEKSYFVYNLSLELAKQIGIRFRQNAIVYGKKQQPPELIWLV